VYVCAEQKETMMELYNLQNDLKVFGRQVKTFPVGIKEAFEELIKAVPDGMERSHYGLSHMTADGKIIYIAASLEKHEGEAEKLNYKRYIIEKGEYLAVMLKNWMSQTDCIKDIFHDMMKDERADLTKQVAEWYKNGDEMMCMVKTISKSK
jgi:predicted transcriptional regulator YdeE